MEDNGQKTPIDKLSEILDTKKSISVDDIMLLVKDILISQEKRISDLELTIDTLQNQIKRK